LYFLRIQFIGALLLEGTLWPGAAFLHDDLILASMMMNSLCLLVCACPIG
jgi:hypothetical protein